MTSTNLLLTSLFFLLVHNFRYVVIVWEGRIRFIPQFHLENVQCCIVSIQAQQNVLPGLHIVLLIGVSNRYHLNKNIEIQSRLNGTVNLCRSLWVCFIGYRKPLKSIDKHLCGSTCSVKAAYSYRESQLSRFIIRKALNLGDQRTNASKNCRQVSNTLLVVPDFSLGNITIMLELKEQIASENSPNRTYCLNPSSRPTQLESKNAENKPFHNPPYSTWGNTTPFSLIKYTSGRP